MAIKEWKIVHEDESGIIWNKRDLDGYYPYNNPTAFVYLYNKGWFRDMEDKYVISTSIKGGSNSEDRINKGFNTKQKALAYANAFMRKN